LAVKIVIQNTSCDDLFEFEENWREREAVKLLVQRVRGTRKSVKREILNVSLVIRET